MEEEKKNKPLWDKIEEKWLRIKSSWEKYATIFLGGFGLLLFAAATSMPFLVYNYFVPDKISSEVTSQDKSEQNISSGVNIFEGLGPVGDFIGGTTVAFLTAASTVFLLATIIMQRKEIKISQRNIEELVKQTKASVAQAEEARKETRITNDTMKQQQFETTFFNMLSLHHQITNNAKVEVDRKTYDGREAISELLDACKHNFAKKYHFLEFCEDDGVRNWRDLHLDKSYIDGLFDNLNTINQEILDEVYGDFHDKYGNIIGHYMRNNYRIVKFIVNNVVDNEEKQRKIKQETGREMIVGDKRFYFGTLRAQWSNAEFELIFINSLYTKNHKFKELILEHDVLDILETNQENRTSTSVQKLKLKEGVKVFRAFGSLIED